MTSQSEGDPWLRSRCSALPMCLSVSGELVASIDYSRRPIAGAAGNLSGSASRASSSSALRAGDVPLSTATHISEESLEAAASALVAMAADSGRSALVATKTRERHAVGQASTSSEVSRSPLGRDEHEPKILARRLALTTIRGSTA